MRMRARRATPASLFCVAESAPSRALAGHLMAESALCRALWLNFFVKSVLAAVAAL